MVFISRALSLMTLLIATTATPLFPKPFVVSDSITKHKMGSHLGYYLDPSGKLSITDISSKSLHGKFRPLPKDDYSFGFIKDAVWLRAVINNATSGNITWKLECNYPLIDDICCHTTRGTELSSLCTGDLKPFSSRALRHRTFVFPVDSPPGESELYIRIATGGSMNISFTAWNEASFQYHSIYESIFIWLFYGLMLSLAVYNLFIFFSIRDLSYLYLSLFTVSMTLSSMSFNGLGFMYLWPDAPRWGNIAYLEFNSTNIITAILFSRTFLDTRINTPRYDRFLFMCIALALAFMILIPFQGYHAAPYITTFSGFIAAMLVVYGLFRLVKGSRPAIFYMTAWLTLLLGVILQVVYLFGFVQEGFLSIWGIQIGSSLLVLLLSLGVADKISIIRREREQALEAIREAEEKYRALIETTDTGYVIIDESGKVMDANSEYVRLTGHLMIDDIINRSVTEWTSPADRDKNTAAVESCMQDGFIRNLEIEYIHGNGTVVPIEINATVIESKEGKRILSICRDYTYRRTVMDNLQASLREKNVLLMEIHHRVKNNLQIISSLISLQSGKITDKEVLMLYEDLNSRIRAMSLIHEHLYQTGDFARIDFAEYIKIITADLQNTYRLYYGNCGVEYDTDHIELDIVKAIPCGLMLNEIISNSFKYAFPPSFKGQAAVRISFHEQGADGIELIVSDNGVGLPPTVEPEMKKTLGLSLIYLLADQIRGTVRIDREGGTKYTVIFGKN